VRERERERELERVYVCVRARGFAVGFFAFECIHLLFVWVRFIMQGEHVRERENEKIIMYTLFVCVSCAS
jgi:hypothetical protein